MCLICKELIPNTSLSSHIKREHKLKVKSYYHKYVLKTYATPRCMTCSKLLIFSNLFHPYPDFCSNLCRATHPDYLNSSALKLTKFNGSEQGIAQRESNKSTNSRVLTEYNKSDKGRLKASETMTQSHLDGKLVEGHSWGFRGWHYSSKLMKNVYHRSSYELHFFIKLDNDVEVLTYEVEPIWLVYTSPKGKIRRYCPDVLITYTSGLKGLVEIKPKYMLDDLTNILKFDAGKKYCEENALTWSVWTEDNF